MSKRIITTALFLILPLTAQCLAQGSKSKPAATSASIKAKIIKYQKRKVAVTITLKSGSVYYYVSRDSEVEQKIDQKIKLSGTIASIGEKDFSFYERWFFGQSGHLKKIRYEDITKVRMNLIPNALKTIGEVALYCGVLLPTGACSK